MPRDVFSREVVYGGAFSADGVDISFTGFGPGMLAQSINYMYQQQISRVYEVNSSRIYVMAGRTNGVLATHRILGPTVLQLNFYAQYGDVCRIGGNDLAFQASMGCGGGGGGAVQRILAKHVVINALGGAISAQDMVLNETMRMMFLWLAYA